MDNKTLRCMELIGEGVSGDALIGRLCEEFQLSEFAADWVVKAANEAKVKTKTQLLDVDPKPSDLSMARMKVR